VVIFGGQMRPTGDQPFRPTARLDQLLIGREGLGDFFLSQNQLKNIPEAARARTVLALAVRPIYAFGGAGDAGQPLDTVVRIDTGSSTPMAMLATTGTMVRTMSAPRVGHTATTIVQAATNTEQAHTFVLVHGGAPPGGSVADLFDPTSETFRAPPTGAGPGRRDHAALLLPGSPSRVLVLGGAGDDDVARGDSLLFDPVTGYSPGPINLKTPRHSFTAFIVSDDLVVVGGFGADGKPVASAEIYNVKTLSFVAEVPAVGRGRATASVLANLSAIVIGGQESADDPSLSSGAVEVYQPLRPQ